MGLGEAEAAAAEARDSSGALQVLRLSAGSSAGWRPVLEIPLTETAGFGAIEQALLSEGAGGAARPAGVTHPPAPTVPARTLQYLHQQQQQQQVMAAGHVPEQQEQERQEQQALYALGSTGGSTVSGSAAGGAGPVSDVRLNRVVLCQSAPRPDAVSERGPPVSELSLSMMCAPSAVLQLTALLRYSGPGAVFGEQLYVQVRAGCRVWKVANGVRAMWTGSLPPHMPWTERLLRCRGRSPSSRRGAEAGLGASSCPTLLRRGSALCAQPQPPCLLLVSSCWTCTPAQPGLPSRCQRT